jgi:hypothetical protein
MPELIPPTVRLHAGWLEAHAEWGPGQHEDGPEPVRFPRVELGHFSGA